MQETLFQIFHTKSGKTTYLFIVLWEEAYHRYVCSLVKKVFVTFSVKSFAVGLLFWKSRTWKSKIQYCIIVRGLVWKLILAQSVEGEIGWWKEFGFFCVKKASHILTRDPKALFYTLQTIMGGLSKPFKSRHSCQISLQWKKGIQKFSSNYTFLTEKLRGKIVVKSGIFDQPQYNTYAHELWKLAYAVKPRGKTVLHEMQNQDPMPCHLSSTTKVNFKAFAYIHRWARVWD